MSVCGGHSRHWFTKRGFTGVRLEKCVRCGAPNPDWARIVDENRHFISGPHASNKEAWP